MTNNKTEIFLRENYLFVYNATLLHFFYEHVMKLNIPSRSRNQSSNAQTFFEKRQKPNNNLFDRFNSLQVSKKDARLFAITDSDKTEEKTTVQDCLFFPCPLSSLKLSIERYF